MQVYLDKFLSESERIKLQKTIASKDFVAKNSEEVKMEFISKDDAAEIFINDTGEDFTEFLGENPLRDAFNITIASGYQQADSLEKVSAEISKMNGVFEINYVEDLVNSINTNFTKIAVVILAFTILLIITIVILINNTIKLALFSQRFLIRSMQLVGAKTGFIIRPFLNRSLLHGFLSGLFASIVLAGLLYYAILHIEDMNALVEVDYLLILFAFMITVGIIIAVLSTYRAVNKYLKMSLDELY